MNISICGYKAEDNTNRVLLSTDGKAWASLPTYDNEFISTPGFHWGLGNAYGDYLKGGRLAYAMLRLYAEHCLYYLPKDAKEFASRYTPYFRDFFTVGFLSYSATWMVNTQDIAVWFMQYFPQAIERKDTFNYILRG